jgi:hypothetical protein
MKYLKRFNEELDSKKVAAVGTNLKISDKGRGFLAKSEEEKKKVKIKDEKGREFKHPKDENK